MQRILIKYAPNYADEYDFYGFTVMTEGEWVDYQDTMRNRTDIEWDFGTNQYNEYDNGGEVLREMSALFISDEEYHTLKLLVLDNYDCFGAKMPPAEGEDE